MNDRDDRFVRDARLQRALEHAPDAHICPGEPTRDAIAQAAREAMKEKPRPSELRRFWFGVASTTSWFTGLAATAAVALITFRHAPDHAAFPPPAEQIALQSAEIAAAPRAMEKSSRAGPVTREAAATLSAANDSAVNTPPAAPPRDSQAASFSSFTDEAADEAPSVAAATASPAVGASLADWTTLRFETASPQRAAALQRDDAGEIPALLQTLFQRTAARNPSTAAGSGANERTPLALALYSDDTLLGRVKIDDDAWTLFLPDGSIGRRGATPPDILQKLLQEEERLRSRASPAEAAE